MCYNILQQDRIRSSLGAYLSDRGNLKWHGLRGSHSHTDILFHFRDLLTQPSSLPFWISLTLCITVNLFSFCPTLKLTGLTFSTIHSHHFLHCLKSSKTQDVMNERGQLPKHLIFIFIYIHRSGFTVVMSYCLTFFHCLHVILRDVQLSEHGNHKFQIDAFSALVYKVTEQLNVGLRDTRVKPLEELQT